MTDKRFYKILTHNYRPPVQGGQPIWDGVTLPFALPPVKLDTGLEDCAAGWNYTGSLADALRIAHLWPDGRPSLALYVEPSSDAVTRGDKSRCSQLTIVGRVPFEEVRAAIRVLSEPFGVHADRMAESQVAWYEALGRPRRNVREVERGLRAALEARGLDWKLERFDSAGDARDARDARAAWDARDAWAAWAAWAARAAWDAWAAWAAWDAWDAWAARDALTIEYAALQEWTEDDPMLLTTGLRDAYEAGLAIAVPTGPDTLGWAMKP